MRPLRVGVVGVGHLGQHHARILSAMPGVELVAVADARKDQAQAVAARCGTAFLSDFRAMLDLVDAVTVAVPTILHREVAGPFLLRGIATLVEKPMAASAAESEQIVEDARAGGAVLQVGHIERFNPALRALEQLPIRPKYVSAERLSTYTFRSTDIGVVLDLMIHDIDLLLSLISAPVRSVAAVGVSLFGEHEDVANARIEFEDGSVANLTASRASYTPTRKMRIWGAEGYASLDFAAKNATLVRPSEQLKRGRLDLEGIDLSQAPAVREHLFGKVLRVDKVEPEPLEPLALELADFISAARRISRPRVSGEDALRAVRLADQVLRSLETHRWNGDTTAAPAVAAEAPSVLRGPHAWRIKSLRQNSGPTSTSH
jgi:predicted dehydrogenase